MAEKESVDVDSENEWEVHDLRYLYYKREEKGNLSAKGTL